MNALKNLLFRIFGQKNHFEKLFFLNEFNDLTGKSRKSIVALSLILALTVSALGYAIGGLQYLGERMDNPFTNWVNLPIKPSYKSKINALDVYFQEANHLDTFELKNVTKYKIETHESSNMEDKLVYPMKTRTVGLEEDILKEILKSGNVVSGYTYKEGTPLEFPKCGVVVKEQALRDNLAYSSGQSINIIPIISSEFIFFPEVVAVVKELPNLSNMLISSHYSNLLNSNFGETGFVQLNAVNQIQFVGSLLQNEVEAKKQIEELFDGEFDLVEVEFEKIKLNEKNSLDKVTLTLLDFLEFEEIRKYPPLLESKKIMKSPRVEYKSECNIGDYSSLNNPHYVAFNFNKLDKVRDFNEFLKSDPRFGMEISMDQVESKENFALVTRLTSLMALILLAFSILSIVFYINSLLTTHLEGIKNNLGTLKAFGLNNRFLVSTYIKIIVLFMLISMVGAFLISFVIKALEVGISKIPVIDLFDYKIFLTLLVILVFSSWTSYRAIKKILLKTPGDLIYNR